MNNNVQTKWSQFISLIIVFFFWGFVAASNDILIPVFKKYFVLSQVQAQLVAWAFYAAYFVGSVIFFVVSLKSDVLQKFGYKKTLSFGLVISAIGAFLFVPAAINASFVFFLSALFIVGLGFSVQQIVANPLAIKMGSADTGAHRLTLAGGVNSLGTTIGPIIVGIALFGMGNNSGSTPRDKTLTKTEIVQNNFKDLQTELNQNKQELAVISTTETAVLNKSETDIDTNLKSIDKSLGELKNKSEAELVPYINKFDVVKKSATSIVYPKEFVKTHLSLVKKPFIVLGIAFLLVAVFMLFAKIDDPAKEEEIIEDSTEKFNILKYPQLALGMLAIFIYVGVEVSIVSNLPALLHTHEFGNILENNIAPFISLYWGSLMIGRWNGGINVFNTSKITNMVLKFIVPFIAVL